MEINKEMEKTLNYIEKNKLPLIFDILRKESLLNKPEYISIHLKNYLRINSQDIKNNLNNSFDSSLDDEFLDNKLIINQFKNKKRKGILIKENWGSSNNKKVITNKDFKCFIEVNIFNDLSHEQKISLKNNIEYINYQKNDIITNFNENTENFYYILSGIILILEIENNKENIKKILNIGEYFNQINLYHKTNSKFKIVAKTNVKLIKLSNDNYISLFKNKEKNNFEYFSNIFEKWNIIENTRENISKIYDCMYFKNYKPGDIILKQGDYNNNLFILFEGNINFYKFNLKYRSFTMDNKIKKKNYFNEEGFMIQKNLCYSVFAESQVKIGILEKNKFDRVF